MNFNDKQKSIICIVRHAETDWNAQGRIQGREEISLNENGIKQALSCAEEIFYATEKFNIKWDKIISSPLGRAKTTAKIIADKIGLPVTSDERIVERDFGTISGYTFKEYEKAIYSDATYIEGIESVENIISRIDDFIKNSTMGGEKIIAVSHGGISRVYAKTTKRCDALKEDDIVRILNCHICVYTYDGENVVLEGYNIAPSDFYKFIGENIE